MSEELKSSNLLKIISYLLLPVMVVVCIYSMIRNIYVKRYPELENKSSYYETEMFARRYLQDIYYDLNQIEDFYLTRYEVSQEAIEGKEQTALESYTIKPEVIFYDFSDNSFQMQILILDKKTGAVYTNVKDIAADTKLRAKSSNRKI